MHQAEKTKEDGLAENLLEDTLSRLGLQFGWEAGHLFILGDENEAPVRATVRARCLQLSLPLLRNPTSEQVGVAFWQEWRRRAEATFLMIDEENESSEMVVCLRLPTEGADKNSLARMIKAGLDTLRRDIKKTKKLMEDVEDEKAA